MRFVIRGVLLCLALLCALASAQSAEVVHWKARIEPSTIAPNAVAEVVFEATIDPGWHLYSLKEIPEGPQPTSFEITSGPLTAFGSPKQQDPEVKLDNNFGKEVELYSDKAWFRIPVKVAKDAKGDVKAEVVVRFMSCNDRQCRPPKKIPFTIPFKVEGSPVADSAAPVAGTTDTTSGTAIEQAKRQGLLAFVVLCASFGFLALLTPCVFPMIPITVSFFAKRRESEGTGSSIGQAAAYSGGIIATFTAIGVIVAAVFGAAGLQKLATNPWLNIALGVLFVVLALNLWGVFEVTIGGRLANRVSPQGKGKYVAPILMALAFTLTSFTCTLPLVGTLLVTASQGDVLYPVVGMLSFSTAFALPFFLLALFPQALAKLPRSGAWMVVVKAFMGFLELAAALKFLSNTDLVWQLGWLTRPVFLAVWAGIMVVAGMYMMGWLKLPKVDDGRIGYIRRGFGLASLATGVVFLGAINGRPLGELDAFLPPQPYPGMKTAESAAEDARWIRDYKTALAKAKAEGKPLFIDFTGVTCTNCRWMEKNMFPRPDVSGRFDKYVLARLYTDRPTPEDEANQKLQEQLVKSVTLPYYVTMTPDGKLIEGHEGSTREPEQFVAYLDRGLNPPTQVASR